MYLDAYESVKEARERIGAFTETHNSIRPHSSLDGQTPDTVYAGTPDGEAGWKGIA